jgi:hypothetical protein
MEDIMKKEKEIKAGEELNNSQVIERFTDMIRNPDNWDREDRERIMRLVREA